MSYLLTSALFLVFAGFILRYFGKKRIASRILGGVAVSGCIILSLMFGLAFLFAHLMCGEYSFTPRISPDGSMIAQVKEMDCGAVDTFHTRVELKNRSLFKKKTDVFYVEDDPLFVEVEWTGPQELTIRYPKPEDAAASANCDRAWQNVQIRCVTYQRNLKTQFPERPEPNRWWW